MATKIEWVRNPDGTPGETWNPVRGCSRIAEGCRNCYAERMAARFVQGPERLVDIADGTFLTTAGPFANYIDRNGHWTGRVDLIPEMLNIPLRRKRSTTYFVNSMSDLFHERLPDDAIDRVFAVMALCPQHRFVVLTKRGTRMREYMEPQMRGAKTRIYRRAYALEAIHGRAMAHEWPFKNLVLGVSASTQADAVEQLSDLIHTPAATWMFSAEPLIEHITLPSQFISLGNRAWVVAGGESGPGARPSDVAWIRSLLRQCREAGVPCFVKQLGARPMATFRELECWPKHTKFWQFSKLGLHDIDLCDSKGADPSEWPEDLRVRELPEVLR